MTRVSYVRKTSVENLNIPDSGCTGRGESTCGGGGRSRGAGMEDSRRDFLMDPALGSFWCTFQFLSNSYTRTSCSSQSRHTEHQQCAHIEGLTTINLPDVGCACFTSWESVKTQLGFVLRQVDFSRTIAFEMDLLQRIFK